VRFTAWEYAYLIGEATERGMTVQDLIRSALPVAFDDWDTWMEREHR
jgi:hypothetical protein